MLPLTYVLMRETLSLGFANNKYTDQYVQLHRLISAFMIQFLKSIIYKHELQLKFYFLASLWRCGDWLESLIVETHKDRLCPVIAYMVLKDDSNLVANFT